MGISYSCAFTSVFLYFYDRNFVNYLTNFFLYVDDIIIFNRVNFKRIIFFICPKDLMLKHINSGDFTSFFRF